MTATATYKMSNGQQISKSRTLDFIQNVPTAQVYLSLNKSGGWSQGINYVNASQLSTIHVQLIEESCKSPTQITNPTVSMQLPKSWTNVTSLSATITDKGTYWEINQTLETIPNCNNKVFNFTGIAPNITELTVVHTTIHAPDSVNATNIHELGIRVVESCTNHTNCSTGRYCNNFMFCSFKKPVGGNCSTGVVYDSLSRNETCISNWCRMEYSYPPMWYCVNSSTDCTQGGISRPNNYQACIDEITETTCSNGEWINITDCNTYYGCNPNSTKATYCGWTALSASCTPATGCGTQTPGGCNDCGDYYTLYPFNECQYDTGITYCDKGCGALCDSLNDSYFNDAGDQCSYSCNDSCIFNTTVTCGDPGDLYGNTCYYDINGCNGTGCTTSSTYCPTYCINDFNGGTCAQTSRTDPTSTDYCYYNRQCLTSGCNLSSSAALRANYCDYCGGGGVTTGDYSPALNTTCTSNCPNNGTRYYDETTSRSDDCNGAGNTNILTENYQLGYTCPSQTVAGTCDNTECNSDCGIKGGACSAGTCNCNIYTNITVFYEDFTPSPYYNYNWSRQETNWDTVSGSNCYGGNGDCTDAHGSMTEATDWINTTANIINLTGANNVYVDFQFKGGTGFSSGQYFRVYCYNGTNWTKFYEEAGGSWDNIWVHRYAIPNSTCWTSNARFKLTIMDDKNNKHFYVDEFRVVKEI